jgi:hypothetical protein
LQQQQQRFFQNNNQSNFNNNQGRVRQPNFHQQQQQQQQNRGQGNQQQQQPANPFIPLQASRKATKSKNPQAEPKQQAKVEVVAPKAVVPMVSTPETKPEAQAEPKKVNTTPTVRKSRLGISFGAQ